MGLDQRERSNGVARHNHPGNHGRLRDGSPPLLVQPEWPSAGLSHIRNFDPSEQLFMNRNLAIDSEPHRTTVKLKHIMVQVPLDEDLMMLLSTQLRLRTRLDRETLFVTDSMKTPLRKPKRDLICGQEIQDRVRKELRDSRTQQGDPGSGTIEPRRSSTFKHDALSSVFNKTRSSLTSYDLNQCESQQWINKYAPASAGEVLQAGAEASLLRNWLQKSTIRSIDTGNGAHASVDRIAVAGRRKKRRKRRAEELDGFIISSDEEADEMDEVTDPEDGIPSLASRQSKRSIIRSGDLTGFSKEAGPAKMTNAVVISGPRGCGKTATVYAIARELGFEVFEINAGSRRSGRDIVDKVGDMTRNHLVRRDERQRDKEGDWSTADEDELETVKALKRDIESGRQGTMNSFFKSKPNAETKRVPKAEAKPDTATVGKARPERTCTEQKQSLILLEEVDVLYDEDKQFWPAVLELIGQSRRPIIMTCNDESLIPWQQLSVHAVLRFSPPPERIAIDYLVLIAAKEGHLLRREAVRTLFMLKRGDLRACLMELDFWCQMGVGDSKGGLEWIYQRWPPGTDLDEQGRTLRVTSQDTYLSGMGLLSQDLCKESDSVAVNVEEELRLEAGETLAGDGGLDDQPQQMGPVPDDSEIDTRSSQRRRLELFQFEEGADNLSAVDVYGGVAKGLDVRLDPTQPRASQKTRCDDVQGYYNLETELMEQGHGLSRRMSICVRMLVDRCLHVGPRVNATRDGPQALEQYLIEDMSNVISSTHRANQFTPADLHDSLAPLAETPKSFLLPTSSGLTSIHRPTTLLAVDVAPYVRSIITSDQHLETQRRQLSNLLSEGGRNGKRVRTTRASRSALEGGKREETRRERWFRDVKINPRTVERTGGVGWQEVARWMVEGGEDDAQAESVSGASRGGGLSQESLGMEG
ncbi:MAG: hypothetical protein M1817_005789 [Caeruleum heppii]|nr:MAG: hypothetical protein M1817_005789 [Caeruleum heppii]